MPRYVSKQDAEKGVEPKKVERVEAEDQSKLDSEPKQKNKEQPPTEEKGEKKAQRQRKPKQPREGQEEKEKDGNKPQKKKEHKPRREREDRPKYNWNRRDVTEETPIPEAPKKILPKPDNEKFREQMKTFKEQKDELFMERKKLIDEQRILIKNQSENKKSGFSALSQYSGELKEKNNIKNIIDKEIKVLEAKREGVDRQIKDLKDHNGRLRNPKDFDDYSAEELDRRAVQLENQLSSDNIDKKQEAVIFNKINNIKRAKLKARPEIEIKTEISKNDDTIDIQYQQFKSLKKQIDAKYKELKPIKSEIYEIMQKKNEEKGTIDVVRPVEEIRAEYDEKIKKVDAKRTEFDKKMDDLRAKHNKEYDAFEDQQDLLAYIKMVKEEKEWIEKKKIERAKREKERQEREKKKKKEFEERERKREEWKKKQQQREQEEKERKEKLQKQREDFINRNPNHEEIDLCNFLINYCENLKPGKQEAMNEDSSKQRAPMVDLKQSDAWKKEAQRGCEVIVGKKNKLEEEAPKKVKKEKKRNAQEEDGSLNHAIDTINRFHQLKVLPPSNVSEIDQCIEQLNEKKELFSKPSEEDVQAFKKKAEAEFDRIHGFSGAATKDEAEGDDQNEEQQKPARHEKRKKQSDRVELKGSDFPELN